MYKTVKNNIVGKIFRTIGFVFLGVSILVYLLLFIKSTNSSVPNLASLEWFKAISNFVDPINVQVSKFANNIKVNGFGLEFYLLIASSVGVLLIGYTQRKGFGLKILLTVTTLLYLIVSYSTDSALITNGLVSAGKVSSSMALITNIDKMVVNLLKVPFARGVIACLPLLFFWMIVAYRKPKKLSLSILRMGIAILMLAVFIVGITNGLASINSDMASFVSNYENHQVYLGIVFIIFQLGYLFTALGSIIGAVFFFTK